jgi:hypothetical protein
MHRLQLIAIAAFGVALSACAVTSSGRQDSTAQEGIWYVKKPQYFPGKTKIFYCPPQSNACYQADVIDPGK